MHAVDGGKCARMDFLLEAEEFVVEAKMASSKLRDKELFGELAEDVARYKKHPKCKFLVCMIYDPGHHVKNPNGLAKDVNELSTDQLQVETHVVPTP
jgi:hypothetical protein